MQRDDRCCKRLDEISRTSSMPNSALHYVLDKVHYILLHEAMQPVSICIDPVFRGGKARFYIFYLACLERKEFEI